MEMLISGTTHGLGKMLRGKLEERGHRVHDLPGSVILSGPEAIRAHMIGLPPCNGIVNNFGINGLSWIGETPPEHEDIVRANLLGPYWVVNYAVHLGWGPGRIVNVASQTYRVAQRCTALYSASKAGLVHMTKVLARELAPQGWIINAVSPGKIEDTEMSVRTDIQVYQLRGWTPERAESYALGQVPMGRYTTKDEMAELILKVLELPSYVNGTVIEAHGGV